MRELPKEISQLGNLIAVIILIVVIILIAIGKMDWQSGLLFAGLALAVLLK